MTLSDPIPYLSDPSQQEHRFLSPTIQIGRAVDNDIVITSKRVSREHARIRQEGRKWLLEDLGSANGTFLNGERVLTPIELRDGDRIALGEIILIYHDPDTTIREDPFPELEVDAAAGVVRLNRKVITLSPKEFTLLVYLSQHNGEVCSKDEISQVVWPEYPDQVYDYQIENLVRRLRTKIENDPNNPQLLLTIRGLGYKLLS
ncbi:MAG: FHA domain-containing protein [Anaerolineales bacterium]|jgi:pSer/pThr/pTyr-binding forkhead associated (FHA) protein